MLLNLLTENSEQVLFLKFSYIIAVVEKEDKHYFNVTIRSDNENHDKG